MELTVVFLRFPWLLAANSGRLDAYVDAPSLERASARLAGLCLSFRCNRDRFRRCAPWGQGTRRTATRARRPPGAGADALRRLGEERPLHRFLVYADASAIAALVGVQDVPVHP